MGSMRTSSISTMKRFSSNSTRSSSISTFSKPRLSSVSHPPKRSPSSESLRISSRNFSSTSPPCHPQISTNTSSSNLSLSTSLESEQASKDYDQQIKDAKSHLASLGFNDVTWVQQIVWGDHDQFQHVNNVHYVRFFETGRMRFAEMVASKMTPQRRQEIIRGTGISMILAAIHVKYRIPVTYPDTLVIAHAPLLPMKRDRFSIRGVAYSLKTRSVVAISTEDCVVYDYSRLSKCDMPEDLKSELEERGINEDGKKKY